MLEALDRELAHPSQGEAITGRGLLELVGGDFASLEETHDFLGCVLDLGLKRPHPVLNGGRGPCFGGVVLESGIGRLKHVWERWWLVRWGRGCGFGGSAGTARVFLGGEFESMCLEFLSCSGKIVRGGLERSDGRAFGNRGGVGL